MFGKKTKHKVTEEEILEALKDCYDPEIPLNIVDLGLIYKAEVDSDNVVYVEMTLTALGCPIGPGMLDLVADRIRDVEGVKDVQVELVWEPQWTPDRVSAEGKAFLGLD